MTLALQKNVDNLRNRVILGLDKFKIVHKTSLSHRAGRVKSNLKVWTKKFP